MSYFPRVWPIPHSLHTLSDLSLGQMAAAVPTASAVWSSANRAIFIPLHLPGPVLVKRLFVVNGTVASGNIDVGLYTAGLARIVSAGSTAQTGTSTLQFFDIADTPLSPGLVYLAVALDNTTGTTATTSVSGNAQRTGGVFQMASAFVLPSTATPAALVASAPLVGIEIGRVV